MRLPTDTQSLGFVTALMAKAWTLLLAWSCSSAAVASPAPDGYSLVAASSSAVALQSGDDIGPYRLHSRIGTLGDTQIPHSPVCHAFAYPQIGAPPPSPVLADSPEKQSSLATFAGNYKLGGLCGSGSHGEVWSAIRLDGDGTQRFVLKRMFLEQGLPVLEAGLREIYYGERVRDAGGLDQVARYVEHFYRYDPSASLAAANELWLVFHDEGTSLKQYLYTEELTADYILYGQSNQWREMKQARDSAVMRGLLYQLIKGVAELNALGIKTARERSWHGSSVRNVMHVSDDDQSGLRVEQTHSF